MRRAAPLLALAAILACTSEDEGATSTVPTVASNPSLGANVEVLYDGWGVPHVYAQSDGDAAYAMGYVQARDRLFEMDLFRRQARGRLSELAGETELEADIESRTIFTSTEHTASGSYRIEDVIAERLQTESPEVLAILQAYAAGVNRYLADLAGGHNGARLPVEYSSIGVGATEVAPWAIEDTLAIGRLFVWQLSGDLERELAYGQLYLAFGGGTGLPDPIFADLTRFAPATESTILTSAAARTAAPSAAPTAPGAAQALAGARAALTRLPRLSGAEKAGSNNWVLSRNVADGVHALVANDPHLSLYNPSLFHLIQISTPTHDVAGVSFPGTPAVEIGHNGKIAWGATVAGYDVTDVYVEQVQVVDGQPVIVTPPGAPPPVVIQETFEVRGGAPVTRPVVLVPNHGPVVSMAASAAYTMKWTGQVPSFEVEAFWNLNKAATVAEAFQAIKKFDVGAQNFVIADSAGNIGYFPHAYVPIRAATCASPPWAPMPGDGSCDWTGRIPEPDDASCAANHLKCLPQALNPALGWVATANNDITGFTLDNDPANDPAYLYAYVDLGYRHAEIVERLSERTSGYTLDDMTAIQSDNVSKFAQALVPGLSAWFASQDCGAETGGPGCVDVLAAKGLTDAAALLASWDFTTPTGLSTADPTSAPLTAAAVAQSSAAAALFHVLVPRLARRILDDDLALYDVDGSPLSVNRFEGMADDQELAKYLAALSVYAQGDTPAVPLFTEELGQSLCAVQPSSGGTGTETCADMAVRALEDAVAFLSEASVFGSAVPADWRWGRLHRVVFENPVGALALLDYGPFANDGGLYTVDVANFSWSDDGSSGLASNRGFMQRSGPNVRFAAEIGASGVRWRAVIPGGESGFPGDAHYEDQIPAWLANDKGDQPYTRAEVDAAAKGQLLFTR